MSKAKLFLGVLAFCLGSSLVARGESGMPVSRVEISNVVMKEGDAGTTSFTAQVTMYAWYSSVTVKISATPGTADETDYSFTTTQLTFAPGSSSQTVSGFIEGDTDPEGDEFFTLTATMVSAGGYPYLYSSGGVITITDDDQERASRLHVEGLTLLEGSHEGTSTADVRVLLEPASSNTVTVTYRTEDVTTVAGLDYRPTVGTLTFAPGEVLKTIPVVIIGDTLFERDETFSVVLGQPQHALLGTARADVVIVNDDALPEPAWDSGAHPPEPAWDGGAHAPEPAWDGGTRLPMPADADAMRAGLDADNSSVTHARDGSATARDTQFESGTGPEAMADSGASETRGEHFAKASGCSCAMGAPGRDLGTLVLAVAGIAGMLAFGLRRSRSRLR